MHLPLQLCIQVRARRPSDGRLIDTVGAVGREADSGARALRRQLTLDVAPASWSSLAGWLRCTAMLRPRHIVIWRGDAMLGSPKVHRGTSEETRATMAAGASSTTGPAHCSGVPARFSFVHYASPWSGRPTT